MSSFSSSTSNVFAVFVVSGGATMLCNALANGRSPANTPLQVSKLKPASYRRMDNMYFL